MINEYEDEIRTIVIHKFLLKQVKRIRTWHFFGPLSKLQAEQVIEEDNEWPLLINA